MDSRSVILRTDYFSANNYHPLPVVLTGGKGVYVWDIEGKRYIDMLSAYSAQNFGHCHPRIVGALVEQANSLAVTSRAFYTDKYLEFVEAVTSFCGMEKVLPCNGGVEAVETNIKISRKWGYEIKGIPSDCAEIIVCEKNFHGRTTTVVSFSTAHQSRNGFGPFTPGFKIIPFGDVDALEKAITSNTAAFLTEPIQGEAGINIPPDGYLERVRNICTEHNVLMVLDEIQTGLGRTGFDLACQYEGIKPDVLILGKALGGGMLPVSAVLTSREIMNVIKPGDHGSTFGGNPLASAVAVESLKVLRDELLPLKARELGGYFMDMLRKIGAPCVKDIRGRGLMIGLELIEEKGIGRRFCEAILKEGVLCKETRDNVVRFAPPLIINQYELEQALIRIEKVLLRF